MHWPGFCGPSYQARSMNVAAERSINLFPVVAHGGTPKVKTWLCGTPGLKSFISFGNDVSGPVRGLFQQNGRAFAVVGQNFYEFFPSGRAIQWGDVSPDSQPAQMVSNGTAGDQILIQSGGRLTLFNTRTNSYIQTEHWPDADIPNPCGGIAFLDGYFIGFVRDTRKIQISAREDGLDWDSLDYEMIATAGDNLRAMATSHRELWLFGEHTGHVWYNAGNADFPFQPVHGVQIEMGILAPYSLVNLDNTLFWVGSNPQGVGIVLRANGYAPERVSTDAVEYFLQSYDHLDRAIGYAYQEEGHSFYVLWIPMSGRETTTWVYDVSNGLWHERATWNEDHLHWEPHEGRCHCYAFGRHFIGSYQSGNIYHQSLEYYDEDLSVRDTSITMLLSSSSPSRSSSRSISPSVSSSRSGSASYSPSVSTSVSSSLSESASDSVSSSLSASSSPSGGG